MDGRRDMHHRTEGPKTPTLARKLLVFLLTVLVLTSCANAPTAPSTPVETLATRLDTLLTHDYNGGKFSGAVLLARGEQVLFSKRYGTSASANNVFQIASLTKQFTALAVLLLQRDGRLNVHDTLCRYLPSCPPSWHPITLHHLLTHTSGIPEPDASSQVPGSPQQLIALYQRKPLSFAPGTRFMYSDEGYQMLGYVIQQVAGQPYTHFVLNAILKPLHMAGSSFAQDDAGAVWSFEQAAGGLSSTADDLYRWDQALMNATLLPAQALKAMFTPYIAACQQSCPTNFKNTHYGYGWYISQEPQRQVLWHTGGAYNYGAYNGYYPTEHVVIIVLADIDAVFGTSYGFLLVERLEGQGFAESATHVAR